MSNHARLNIIVLTQFVPIINTIMPQHSSIHVDLKSVTENSITKPNGQSIKMLIQEKKNTSAQTVRKHSVAGEI